MPNRNTYTHDFQGANAGVNIPPPSLPPRSSNNSFPLNMFPTNVRLDLPSVQFHPDRLKSDLRSFFEGSKDVLQNSLPTNVRLDPPSVQFHPDRLKSDLRSVYETGKDILGHGLNYENWANHAPGVTTVNPSNNNWMVAPKPAAPDPAPENRNFDSTGQVQTLDEYRKDYLDNLPERNPELHAWRENLARGLAAARTAANPDVSGAPTQESLLSDNDRRILEQTTGRAGRNNAEMSQAEHEQYLADRRSRMMGQLGLTSRGVPSPLAGQPLFGPPVEEPSYELPDMTYPAPGPGLDPLTIPEGTSDKRRAELAEEYLQQRRQSRPEMTDESRQMYADAASAARQRVRDRREADRQRAGRIRATLPSLGDVYQRDFMLRNQARNNQRLNNNMQYMVPLMASMIEAQGVRDAAESRNAAERERINFERYKTDQGMGLVAGRDIRQAEMEQADIDRVDREVKQEQRSRAVEIAIAAVGGAKNFNELPPMEREIRIQNAESMMKNEPLLEVPSSGWFSKNRPEDYVRDPNSGRWKKR